MVIISSFYNEEYLLPWWLKHHREIFSHGILFDYFSTDRSVEIIKKLCPTWEVLPTDNKDWNFKDNDEEYMLFEREIPGYKMVLTTTEFLVGELPRLYSLPSCFSIPFYRIIDTDPENPPTYDKPLIEQKNHRYVDKRDRYKRRFLHNYPYGQYEIGRHATKLEHEDVDMWIYKYVYAPWTDEFINRKLAMKDHMSQKDIDTGRGKHHTWDREKLDHEYRKQLKTISN